MMYDYTDLYEPLNIEPCTKYFDRDPEAFKILEYKDITPDKYVISSYGRVFNKITGKEYKQSFLDSYMSIELTTEPKGHRVLFIHELVAAMYIYDYQKYEDQKMVLTHKNKVRSCNYCENLTYLEYRNSHSLPIKSTCTHLR